MSRLKANLRKFQVDSRGPVGILELRGNIDAESRRTFGNTIRLLLDRGYRWLILDLWNVDYVNSTGLGILMKFQEELQEKGGGILLSRVDRNVGQVIHVLGVTDLFPIFSSKKAAFLYVLRDDKESLKERQDDRIVQFIDKRAKALPKDATVFFFLQEMDEFVDTVQLRLSGEGRSFHKFSNVKEGWEQFEERDPDLILMEDRLPGTDEFIQDIKTRRKHSLVPIVKIYDEGTDPGTTSDFYIWENDSLVEPFEMMRLFSLTEAELVRVRRRKDRYLHHLHFSFRYSPEHREQAERLGKGVIQQSDLSESVASGFSTAFFEAMDNAIRHGNQEDPNKRVDVVFLVSPKKISVSVADEGTGFDYERYLEKARNQETRERARESRERGKQGGLGMKLMEKFSDEIQYDSPGNRVKMTKYTSKGAE